MSHWADSVAPLRLAVDCGGASHAVRWERGELVLPDHPDVDAELALVAFGGEEPECIELLQLWRDAIADGGFLGEWVDEDLDQARLWWLGMALERMRSEGFHEFLRELPPPRAARMGQFVTHFPARWLDRAAAAVSEAVVDGEGVVCERAPQLLPPAVARRLRTAFVRSVGGRQVALGGAALVPFEPVIDPPEPFVEGRIHGRASRVRVGVGQRWLFDVWAVGAAVVDGHLVLAVEHQVQSATALMVNWREAADGGSEPVLVTGEIEATETGWRLRSVAGQ